MSDNALAALAALLEEEGGLLADAIHDGPYDGPTDFGDRAAAGPRATGHEAEYAQLVEAIREGYLLHYGAPGQSVPSGAEPAQGRVVRTPDPDLALLAGDRLYALGLERLAALGDLEAVEVLADLISESARVNAEGRPGDAGEVWARSAAAVGDGRQAHH